MATSTKQFTKETVGKLQVEEKFKSLVSVATGKDSAYIRAKETLLAYFDSTDANAVGGELSKREKAEMLSKLVSDMAVGITNHMMDVAVKIETEDRDAPYALAKVVADTKTIDQNRDKIATDITATTAQIEKIAVDISKIGIEVAALQAGTYTKTGLKISTADYPIFADYTQYALSTDLVDAKGKNANMYTTLVSSYRKDGIKSAQLNTSTNTLTIDDSFPDKGLTKAQTSVAVRQEKAFDDNMHQHAANSSASFMGLLLSSGDANLLSATAPDSFIVNEWLSSIAYLNSPVV